MDEHIKESIDLVRDITKQVLSLATGTIALTVTFLKDFLKDEGRWIIFFVFSAWILLLLSILFGILAMLALGTNIRTEVGWTRRKTYSGRIRFWATLQLISFFIGLVLTVIFGMLVVIK